MNSALLKSIEKGKKLKKAQTNDRSAPIIEKAASSVASSNIQSPTTMHSAPERIAESSASQMGGLFQNGFPTLRKVTVSSKNNAEEKPKQINIPLKNESIKPTHSSPSSLKTTSSLNTSRSPPPPPLPSNSSLLNRQAPHTSAYTEPKISSKPEPTCGTKSNVNFPPQIPEPRPLSTNPVSSAVKPQRSFPPPSEEIANLSISKSNFDTSSLKWVFPTVLPHPRPFPKVPKRKSFFGF